MSDDTATFGSNAPAGVISGCVKRMCARETREKTNVPEQATLDPVAQPPSAGITILLTIARREAHLLSSCQLLAVECNDRESAVDL
ncbi:hypothetical protein ASE04_18880 [Rhizobium sp. Root708]|nr:hypothetical protein ASE04_18880 [Rhizobium sp. Root708]